MRRLTYGIVLAIGLALIAQSKAQLTVSGVGGGFGGTGAYVPDGIQRSPNNMTNNTTPSPFVASASSVLGGFGPFMAFDGITNDGGGDFWHSNAMPAAIEIDLGSAQYCASYRIYQRGSGAHMPVDWVVEGSNDNSSWTTVDTRSGQSWAGASSTGDHLTFTPATPMQFRYWRMTVSTSESGTDVVNIPEWEIYS